MSSSGKKVVLITGGTGLVGSGIRASIERDGARDDETFIYLSSKDANLQDIEDTRKAFEKYRPTHVIHLAARVGGLFANMNYPVGFYRENIRMNDTVMELCKEFKVTKLISCLSTCIFPDKTTYPIDETMVHNGPPHFSNAGYAYAKRMIDIMNRAYKTEFGCNFTSVIPTNVYGPGDNFHLKDGHVLPALIHKAYIAKRDGTEYYIWGSGTPMRQFIYNEDLGRLFLWVMRDYESVEPITLSVGEEEEVSIRDAALMVAEAFEIPDAQIHFDTTKADGQFKKTASNAKLRGYLPFYKFKELRTGIQETCKWFKENYELARK